MSAAETAANQIAELIDRQEYGQAEGALESAFARYPNNDALLAVQSLLLADQGNLSRAQAIATAVSTRAVTSPGSVQLLIKALQRCCCWAELAATYERLVKQDTVKEQATMENLVQTYVRMGAYDRVQQTAMQLYRKFANPNYQAWVVAAMLAQVPDGATDHLLLKLATRMLDSSVLTEKGKPVPGTARAYVDVLLQQQQPQAAVDFLISPRGSAIGLPETRLEALAEVYLRIGGHRRRVNAIGQHLWRLFSDNWTHFTLYRQSLTADGTEAEAEAEAEAEVLELPHPTRPELAVRVEVSAAHTTMEEGLALCRELQERERTERPRKMQRGPFMAELALLADARREEALSEAVLRYAQTFCRKPCCYLDLSTFLTPASAAAVHAWCVAPREGGETELEAHTRRILGLRCLVACWPLGPGGPCIEELRAVVAECRSRYDEARPLSASLPWSEEGLCDGYLSVAVNACLYAYEREGRAAVWAREGLRLLSGVDRRSNNPGWLLLSVALCQLLGGLADTAALHQLAFKSVQHDTMSHVGYWPLRRALALEDVRHWGECAEEYYERLERDCSLMRAKVFRFLSWPAMAEVKEFERRQLASAARLAHTGEHCTAQLRTCQTAKGITEHMLLFTDELRSVCRRLATADARAALVDNTDWTVVKSVILGDIHGDKVAALAAALVPHFPLEERLDATEALAHSLVLLHDVAAVLHHQQALRAAPRPRGKAAQKKAAAAAAGGDQDPAVPPPTLLAPSLAGEGVVLRPLPLIAPFTEPVLAFIAGEQRPAGQPQDSGPQYEEAAFEDALYPGACIASALLRLLPLSALPVREWAASLSSALQASASAYRVRTGIADDGDDGTGAAAAVSSSVPHGGEDTGDMFRALVAAKEKRVKTYVAELVIDLNACANRKQ